MQQKFDLRPSVGLASALVLMHAAALAALFFLNLPFWVLAVMVLLLSVSALHYLRRDAWLTAPSSCLSLCLEGSRIALTERSGKQCDGWLMPGSLITPLLSVVNIQTREDPRMRSVIILPDSLDAESFRQLRVALKWKGYSNSH